jgi:hypothetical protein
MANRNVRVRKPAGAMIFVTQDSLGSPGRNSNTLRPQRRWICAGGRMVGEHSMRPAAFIAGS